MSWEYDPREWAKKSPPLKPPTEPPPLMEALSDDSKMIAGVVQAMRHITGDPDEVLSNRTIFGVTWDTDNVEDLRLALAFMIVYKDME